MKKKDAPRGIRNNNPGNIEKNPANNWFGMLPPGDQWDSRFVRFADMVWGCRALLITLRTYRTKRECDTVRKIINRWAPSMENDSNAYLRDVVRLTGFSADEVLPDLPDTYIRLGRAIAHHENGTAADEIIPNKTWDEAAKYLRIKIG